MQDTLAIIEEALATAKSPVVLSSFGKDSLLLLYFVRLVDPNVPVLYFRDKLNPFAERVIKEWDLQVFGYAPADRYLIPDKDDLILVDEFCVGANRLPVLRDVVQGEKCELENLPTKRTPSFSYPWDVTFLGFKASDAQEHFVTQNTVLPIEFNLGHTKVISPLFDWDDEDVLLALEEFDIPYEKQDDSLRVCQQCLNSLEDWDRAASLSIFQKRFGFDQVH
jgi:3'-phosphoadenosine 5'-phosphosulfate sulfotransferase (PAPS reductase)/FAD synthetase